MVMMFLVYALDVSAAVTASVSISGDRKGECNGTIGECFIGEELEMLMGSEISRRQLGPNDHPVYQTGRREQGLCGRDSTQSYSGSCLSHKLKIAGRGCKTDYQCRQVPLPRHLDHFLLALLLHLP
ncbi:Rapid ALkalinization Factor [Dillenia turbinata]|uniref:Rapid ALkalinization Factor n=1 Tax=Dillenia turbinata TaxID=194707 RepID=A0AAN8YUQ4_9MAGN